MEKSFHQQYLWNTWEFTFFIVGSYQIAKNINAKWDHLFSKYAKIFRKTNISYPWYAHVYVLSWGYEMTEIFLSENFAYELNGNKSTNISGKFKL